MIDEGALLLVYTDTLLPVFIDALLKIQTREIVAATGYSDSTNQKLYRGLCTRSAGMISRLLELVA